MKNIVHIAFFCVSQVFLFSCTKDKIPAPASAYQGYPEEVGKILLNNCATSGCHNNQSYQAAAGLNLSSWDNLFNGAKSGSAVIPFSPDQSPLMFFINTYPEFGVQLQPTMPINGSALGPQQVALVREWIASGAPNNNGFVKFSDNQARKKFYVVNQGCDMVTVFDAETKLAMRYIKVGTNQSIESPHMIKVSPDGQHWYLCFLNSPVIQKFRTSDDSFAGNITIGPGNWNTFAITADSKKAFAVDWAENGVVAVVDLENKSMTTKYQGSNFLKFPHGSAINKTGNTLYLTAQKGNYIYKLNVSDIHNPEKEEIVLEPGAPLSFDSKLDAHEIILAPDESKYFVTCQKSNEVRVMQTSSDNLLAVIPVGIYPQELAISKTTDYLFVTSPEDTLTFPGKRGSVTIINYKTHSVVKKVFTGFQPHGIAVDDYKKRVYVANRNADPSGPAPHHSSSCAGRNGYLTIIDLTNLEVINSFKTEVSVDPYSIAIRE